MMFSFDQVITLVGVSLTFIGSLVGMAKWLIARQDAGDARVANTAQRAHERLDALPKEFIRREEVIGHFERIESQLGESRRETNQRLDRMYEILLDRSVKSKE